MTTPTPTAWAEEVEVLDRVHVAKWSDEVFFPAQPEHELGWIGKKEVNVPIMSASATIRNPSAQSSAVITVPPSSYQGFGFPYEFPFTFESHKVASMMSLATVYDDIVIGGQPVDIELTQAMEADAVFYDPVVETNAPWVNSEPFEADAELYAPIIDTYQVVYVPRIGVSAGFPYQFPFFFSNENTFAELYPPEINSTVTSQIPRMEATVGQVSPTVQSAASLTSPKMAATAALITPAIQVSQTVQPPRMDAHCSLQASTSTAGATVPAPLMQATAAMPSPTAVVTLTLVVHTPMMGGGAAGFPYEFPYDLEGPEDQPTRAWMNDPDALVVYEIASPRLEATAAIIPPARVDYYVTAPRMASSAALRSPTAVSHAQASSPKMYAQGDVRAATHPSIEQSYVYNSVGSFTFTLPTWWQYLDILVLGGGGGGGGGNATIKGEGGDAGVWGWTTITRGNQVPYGTTSLTVTVADGGKGGSGNIFSAFAGSSGQQSKVANGGTNLSTGNGGDGGGGGNNADRNGDAPSSGNQNSGRDVVLNGYLYAGGLQTTSGTTQVPGSGGYGGNNSSSGIKGGRGQVWLRAFTD